MTSPGAEIKRRPCRVFAIRACIALLGGLAASRGMTVRSRTLVVIPRRES
jgi:hypothetical protein